jgi:transcriptional regulator with XRE-family HTH domain
LKRSTEVAAQFGRNLARCRERAGLSQEELGYRAQVHRTEVSLLERGARTPRADTIVKLAGSVSAPVDDLLAGLRWTPGRVEVIVGGFELVERSGAP